MTKVKHLNWDDLCKKVKLKGKTKEIQLQATSSLFSMLLVIARSERQLDLETAISEHEFNSVSPMLMNQDATL